jgi:hypothetical protein
MGLIEEIRDKAVSGKIPLEDVMRSCMVLAAKLKHEPLKQWTHNELNGYSRSADVPDYRVVRAQLRYPPIGVNFGSDLVSTKNMQPELENLLRRIRLGEGIAELEAIQKKGGMRLSMPEEIQDYIGLEEFGDASGALTMAYRDVSASTLQGVLSAIRNRVLEFVLSLEDQSTAIDKAAPGTKPLSLEKVDDKFGIYIMGNQNVVTVAGQSALVQTIQKQVVRNDIASLKAFLSDQGASEEDLKQLDKVIVAAQPADLENQRSALYRWANKAAKSIAGGGKSLLQAAAKEAVLLSIRYYFGEIAGTSSSSPGGTA